MTDGPNDFLRGHPAGDREPEWPLSQFTPPASRGLRAGQILGLSGLGVVALTGLLGGWPSAAILGSMYLALVLLWHIARGRSWLNLLVPRLGRKKAALLGLPAALALFVAGSLGLPPTAPTAPVTPAPQAVTTTPTPTPTPEPAPSPSAGTPAGPAAEVLATLAIRDTDPELAYDRTTFGQAWADTDRNGCDTRNDVLRRDLLGFQVQPGTQGCVVLSGTLNDRYTGETLPFEMGTATIAVDHVVSLRDAWLSGAHRWTAAERESFANDPLNLLATSHSVNTLKGERDASGWLPPNGAFVCEYVTRQVVVKAKYHLTLTSSEAAGIASALMPCAGQQLPMEAAIPLAPEPITPSAAPASPVPMPLQSGAGSTTQRTTTTSTTTRPVTTTRTSTTTRPPTTTRTSTSAPSKPVDGCVIKGNISSSGERIYHVPGQQFYDVTKIDVSKGERWFCSEQAALDAGWRKSLR